MCEIERATSFNEVNNVLTTNYFDIAILDIMGVDSYKLLEAANQKNIITVILSAHALSIEDTVEFFKKGAASHVPKDQMANIATCLIDVFEAKEKGKHFWWRWLDRFNSHYVRVFG